MANKINTLYAVHVYKNADDIASIFKKHIESAFKTMQCSYQLLKYANEESRLAVEYMCASEPIRLGFVDEEGDYVESAKLPEPRDSYSCIKIYDSFGTEYSIDEYKEIAEDKKQYYTQTIS